MVAVSLRSTFTQENESRWLQKMMHEAKGCFDDISCNLRNEELTRAHGDRWVITVAIQEDVTLCTQSQQRSVIQRQHMEFGDNFVAQPHSAASPCYWAPSPSFAQSHLEGKAAPNFSCWHKGKALYISLKRGLLPQMEVFCLLTKN